MNETRRWARGCGSAALAMLLVLPAVARAQDRHQNHAEAPPPHRADEAEDEAINDETADEADAPDRPRPARKLRIFELEHRNPQEIEQILLLRPHRAVRPPRVREQARPGEGEAGYGTLPPEPQVPAVVQRQRLLVASHPERRLLFVRGSEEQISSIEELVKALDMPEGKLQKQTFGELHLIPVHSKHASRIDSILAQLQLDSQMVQMGDVYLMVIHAGDTDEDREQLEQAEEVISTLEKERARTDDEEEKVREDNDRQENDSRTAPEEGDEA